MKLSLKKEELRVLSDEDLDLLDQVVGGDCWVTCNNTCVFSRSDQLEREQS
ncbi:hypothetical protein [Archangium primigenium]|uniref:hypothetical protein n=1 Tax=[Archangium] primigenium TaxID=2792470 RepID=UPI00195DFE70|nr:hypothetical protein [Archangium primigenium]MBM7112809.1 hypothetical protein [Archangium primigenium]